jgi:tRNA A-37 threonylcarbamoyl transferase component Bud32
MPHRTQAALNPERATAILEEALRRVDAGIPDHAVDLLALRRALESELAKGPTSLVTLMKIGRRQALDRISRLARKGAGGR